MTKAQDKRFTINDLPKSERPRERLQKHGAEVLSSQELLALILGRGVRGESVMVTAQRLLSAFGNVKNISQASLEELSTIKGMGTAKASQLKAAFELARRKEEDNREQISVKSHQDVVKILRQRLKDKKKENFLIDNLVGITELQIEKLKEYRQTLISNVVTGKVRVNT